MAEQRLTIRIIRNDYDGKVERAEILAATTLQQFMGNAPTNKQFSGDSVEPVLREIGEALDEEWAAAEKLRKASQT